MFKSELRGRNHLNIVKCMENDLPIRQTIMNSNYWWFDSHSSFKRFVLILFVGDDSFTISSRLLYIYIYN